MGAYQVIEQITQFLALDLQMSPRAVEGPERMRSVGGMDTE